MYEIEFGIGTVRLRNWTITGIIHLFVLNLDKFNENE